jgi:hypothetical protein
MDLRNTEQLVQLLVQVSRAISAEERKTRLLDDCCSPQTKMMQKQIITEYRNGIDLGKRWKLSDVGFRVFSQFEEDGILLYIFAAIGVTKKLFVDVGSSDGILSNCANLALNHHWHGLFIDGSAERLAHGKRFYESAPDTFAFPPRFRNAFIQRENINQIIQEEGFRGEIDLLSIDIDGNDYWVWEALSVVDPRVVVIETHVEFGMRSIVVPYDKDYCYPGRHPRYHGASAVAMTKLASRKGYRLVGSNSYGFNLFFVKRGIGDDVLPEVGVETVLNHPSMEKRQQDDAPIMGWEFAEV